MKTHASGKGSKYVARKRFKKLLNYRLCKDKSKACKAEYSIKQLPKHEKLSWFYEKS